MTTAQIIQYVLLGVFALSAFIGFLFGLGRGFSKALLRLVFFILFAGIAVMVTPYISTFVLDIPLNIGTLSGSVGEIINDFVQSNEMIASMVQNSEVLQEFVTKLPITLVNLVMFVILLFVFSSISWIVFAIFSSVFGKKYKEPQKPKQIVTDNNGKVIVDSKLHVNFNTKKPKKYRLLGGLVGAVNSLILLALVLVPVTGFLSIGTNLLGSTEGNVAYAASGDKTPTAQILDDYIPAEAKEYLQVYRESPIYYISKYTGADSFIFDSLTTVRINANNENFYISYRSEIYSLAKLYDNVEFLTELDFENLVYADLDYEKLETAIDTVLSSRLIRTVTPELINWVIDEINLPENQRHIEINLDQQIIDTLNLVVGQYNANGGVYLGLTQDLKTVFDVFESLGSSGIIDEALSEQIDIEQIISMALANDREVTDKVFGNVFSAISLRTIMVDLINEQLNALTLSQDVADRITFSPISLSNINWTNVKTDFLSIINNAIDIYESASDDFTSNLVDLANQNPYELLNADFGVVTTKLGQIMTTIQESQFFVNSQGQKVLYNQFMDYLNKTQLAEYINFTEFKTANVWSTEMSNLNNLIDALKDSGLISVVVDTLESENGMENIDFNDLIDKLSTYAPNNKTYISNIISPILDSVAFRKVLNVGFDYLNSLITSNQEQLGTGVVLGKIQSSAILNEDERVNILMFFDNMVLYAHEIDFATASTDLFSAIIESNLTRLGMALDSVKESALFGPYEENEVDYEGIYAALIHALANNNQFNQFAAFEIALEEDFSWNQELSLVQTAIEEMNSIVINYGGVNKTLIQAIIDGEDLTQIINVLTNENIDNLVNPLVSSRLLGKNLVMIVNVMNNQMESILSTSIADLPTTINLTNQANDIKTIIKQILAIYPDIKNGLDATQIETLSSEIGTLLNTIKANALRTDETGIFAGTYGAIITYLRSDATFGAKFTYIMDEYVDAADINWQDLLSLTVDVKDLGANSNISTALSQKLSSIIADMYQGEIYGEITGDIITILNNLITISSSTSEETILDLVASALQILADSQNEYVLANVGTEEEYSQKVDQVISFFEGLTGITQFDQIKNITDYQAEVDAIEAIDTMLALVNGETPEIQDVYDFVDALANSDLILSMLEDNGITIEMDEALESQITTHIEETFAGDQTLIDTLKTILNLI